MSDIQVDRVFIAFVTGPDGELRIRRWSQFPDGGGAEYVLARQLSGPIGAARSDDTPLMAAAREAGWALAELVDGIDWRRRGQVQGIIGRLGAALEAAGPHVGPDIDAKALEAVEAIFADLRDRRFLKWLFSHDGDESLIGRFDNGEELRGIDLEAQGQIKAAWQVIIANALATAEERTPSTDVEPSK